VAEIQLFCICPVVQVQLARELALPYASIALVTDYDCWRDDELLVCT